MDLLSTGRLLDGEKVATRFGFKCDAGDVPLDALFVETGGSKAQEEEEVAAAAACDSCPCS